MIELHNGDCLEVIKDYFAICEKRIADAQKQDLQTKLAI